MTKFVLSRPDGPWDYPSFGFRAANGAVLDGSLFTPPITNPPDRFWTVYGGGSAQTGVTLIGGGGGSTSASISDGMIPLYRRSTGGYIPTSPSDVFSDSAVTPIIEAAAEAAVGTVFGTRLDDAEAELTGRLSSGELAASIDLGATAVTYATVYGRKVGFLGDSITHSGPNNTALRRDNSPSMCAMLYSDGRWEYLTNAGVDGDTLAQMRARVQVDIIDKGCNVCVLAFGSNDQSTASEESDLAAIHANLAAAGVQLVLATMPPVFDRLGDVSRTNAMIRRYATNHGLPVAEQHTPVTNVATGQWKTGYDDTGDGGGVHPAYKARPLMGKAIDDALRTVIPGGSAVRLVDHAMDPRDMLEGAGLFLGARNTGVAGFVPQPWDQFTGTGAGSTYSVEAGVGPVLGNWMDLDVVTGTGANYLYRDIALTAGPGSAIGERVWLTGRFRGNGGLASEVQLRFVNSGGADVAEPLRPFSITDNVLTSPDGFNGVWAIPGTIPTGTHHMQLLAGLHAGGAGNTGEASLGQIGLWNLTRDAA